MKNSVYFLPSKKVGDNSRALAIPAPAKNPIKAPSPIVTVSNIEINNDITITEMIPARVVYAYPIFALLS